MSPLKVVLLALALVLPGGSLLLLGMAAVNVLRGKRLLPAKVPVKALPPTNPNG